jgi:hypothetical protein
MLAATPVAQPIVSSCLQCLTGLGEPYMVSTDGPEGLIIGFHCRSCGYEWTERWDVLTSAVSSRTLESGIGVAPCRAPKKVVQ